MTVWNVSRPPEIDERIARWSIDDPPGLQALRAALRRAVLARRRSPTIDVSDLAERLVLVATELAGNALRHGRAPAVVALLRADEHLIVDVVDHDPQSAPVARQRAVGEGGLGLPLSERLAEDVGWYPTGSDKHVWAKFLLPSG